jgi:hypothetical protein
MIAHVYCDRGVRLRGLFPDLVLFKLVVPPVRSGGALSDMGCIVPQSFAAGGNRSQLDSWAVTGDPRH